MYSSTLTLEAMIGGFLFIILQMTSSKNIAVRYCRDLKQILDDKAGKHWQ
jgi:hypothetical protein